MSIQVGMKRDWAVRWALRVGSLLLAVSVATGGVAQSTDDAQQAREEAQRARQIAEQQRELAIQQGQQAERKALELTRELDAQRKAFEAQRRAYEESIARLQHEIAERAGSQEKRAEALERAHQHLELMRAKQETEEAQRRAQAEQNAQQAKFKLFKLQYVRPQAAAGVLHSILGDGGPRIAIDDRTSTLLVAGDEEQFPVIELVIRSLDEPSPGSKDPDQAESLQLRILWLLDGLPEGAGKAPTAKLLSPGVVDALRELGFEDPKVVCQQVSTLTLRPEGPQGTFQFDVPVLVNAQRWEFGGKGRIEAISDDRFDLEFQLQFGYLKPPDESQERHGGRGGSLGGSIYTPLGHYTVMGTTTIVATSELAQDPATGKAAQQQHLSAFVVYLDRAREFRGDAGNTGGGAVR